MAITRPRCRLSGITLGISEGSFEFISEPTPRSALCVSGRLSLHFHDMSLTAINPPSEPHPRAAWRQRCSFRLPEAAVQMNHFEPGRRQYASLRAPHYQQCIDRGNGEDRRKPRREGDPSGNIAATR